MTSPNIIIIHTDQQRRDTLSCYGSTFTSTPNIDRLANEGVTLERAYCTNPVCTPSRVSIFSGLSVSRHGAWNVGVNVANDGVTMVSHRLAAAGYRTHMIGKAHFQGIGKENSQSLESATNWRDRYPQWTGPYFGFQTIELALGHTSFGLAGHYGAWVEQQVGIEGVQKLNIEHDRGSFYFGGNAYDWDFPTRLHNSVWTADRTIDFLQKHDCQQPFLLSIGFQDPHHPHSVPRDWSDRVDPAGVPTPDFTPGELDDKPPHFLSAHRGRLKEDGFTGQYKLGGQGLGGEYGKVTEREAREGRAYYYTMVKIIDQQMGRILDMLDHLNLTENTLVFFTTDHGELLGDHGLWLKGPYHYDQLVRVPMLVRWPKAIPAGMRSSAIFSHIDIVPTCLAAAGLDMPRELDGVNALPLLQQQTPSIRDHAIVECIDDPHKLRLKTIITETHKLTWYCGQTYGELYDLTNDPREKKNLWHDASHAGLKAQLLSRVLNHMDTLEADHRWPRFSYA